MISLIGANEEAVNPVLLVLFRDHGFCELYLMKNYGEFSINGG